MKKILNIIFSGRVIIPILIIITALFYMYYSDTSELFKADIIDNGASNSNNKDLYISNAYTGLNNDTGNIDVATNNGLSNIAALSFTLQYNANQVNFSKDVILGNFTDSSGNLMKPEIIVITPDNTKGSVIVDIASSTPFSIAANEVLLTFPITIQNNLPEKTKINVNFSETQIIDELYNIKSASTANGIITIEAFTEPLITLDAKALTNQTVSVTFDDYLASANNIRAKFSTALETNIVFDPNNPNDNDIASAEVSSDDGKKLILTSKNAFIEGTTYKLVFYNGPKGNAKVNLSNNHKTTYFTTPSTKIGTNVLLTTKNLDINTIELDFSSAVDPINGINSTKYYLFDSDGNKLTIKSATINSNDNTIVTIVTANALIKGSKCYLIAEKIGNISNQRINYFFVSLADDTKIISIEPESLPVNGGTVTITGQNLNQITRVVVNKQNLIISSQEANKMNITIPSGFAPELYDMQFYTQKGQVIVEEDFLLIEKAIDTSIMKILSEESYASPKRVPNDGKTETVLWALVENPNGISDINKVTLDLRQIGGSAISPMIDTDKDGQAMITDNKRWYYLKTVIPETVKTSETPIEIKVTAENTKGNKAYGTISIIVSKNIKSSETPEILQAYGTPTIIKAGEKMGFYTHIKDLDGIQDIDKVIVDLGTIGLGPKSLIAASSIQNLTKTSTVTSNQVSSQKLGVSSQQKTNIYDTNSDSLKLTVSPNNNENIPQERTTEWYGLEDIIIPTSTNPGEYTIQVIATDKSGEEGKSDLKFTVGTGNRPKIDGDRTELTPRTNIPNDGKEKFTVTTYISDEDGIEDITSVVLDVHEIGGTSVEMNLQGDIKKGQKGGWFIAKDITVAIETTIGNHNVLIYAYDKQGNEVKYEVELRVTNEDEIGKAPIIDSTRSYTTPSAVQNNEETPVTLNVFIEKHDFDITQVMVDLENIAKFTGKESVTSVNSSNSCIGSTERMVCLSPGIVEGTRGQWYTISNVVVLKTTPTSMEPYRIRVTVTDIKGKSSDGFIFLHVGDGTLPTPQSGFPKVQMAISTSPENIEVLFSSSIDPKKVQTGAFKITETTDTTKFITIKNVVMNADATVANITTSTQVPVTGYTLFADAKILGLKEAQYTDNHANFIGFEKRDMPPQLAKITAKSSTLIELIFSEGLRPSSVASDGRDFEIFTNETQPQKLKIYHTEFQDDNQTLKISTDEQVPGMPYIIRVRNSVISAAGVKVGGNERSNQTAKKLYFGIHKDFIGFKDLKIKEKRNIIESVDFDGNGKIDFTDFTIFSSVYGQSLINPNTSVETSTPGKSQYETTPLENKPNSSIPNISPTNTTSSSTTNPEEPIINVQGVKMYNSGSEVNKTTTSKTSDTSTTTKILPTIEESSIQKTVSPTSSSGPSIPTTSPVNSNENKQKTSNILAPPMPF